MLAMQIVANGSCVDSSLCNTFASCNTLVFDPEYGGYYIADT
jgi:hypothetical protein